VPDEDSARIVAPP